MARKIISPNDIGYLLVVGDRSFPDVVSETTQKTGK